MSSITPAPLCPERAPGRRLSSTPDRIGNAVAGGLTAAVGLLVGPVHSLAATTTDCASAPVVPESPAGPALLIVAAIGALGFLAYRRRGGLAGTITLVPRGRRAARWHCWVSTGLGGGDRVSGGG